MENWKSPQERAEAEDAMRDAAQADNRESSGKAVHVDGAQVFPPKELENIDDSREKLEADVEAHYTHTVSTAMWPESANKMTRYVSVPMDKVLGWLDRQAAIAERETVKQWEEQASELACHVNELTAERDEQQRNAGKLEAELRDVKEHAERQRVRISELENLYVGMKAQRDALQEKVDEFELREKCAPDYDFRQAAERWEEAFEDKCAELILLQEQIDELFAERDALKAELLECDENRIEFRDQRDHLQDRVDELKAERERLLEQLNRVWLKDADGKPLHIGDARYGEDGTEWRVTGFRWGSSHPVQGVDAKGRRRDLKPEWLSSENPDSWERVRSELGCLMVNIGMYGSKYPGDPDAELDAILERARGLAGGSE